MSNGDGPGKRHLSVDRFHRISPYKSHKAFRPPPVPVRPDPGAHGHALVGQVTKIQQDYSTLAQSWEGREDIRARGIIIELESAPDVELPVGRFEEAGLELLNERDERDAQGKMVTRRGRCTRAGAGHGGYRSRRRASGSRRRNRMMPFNREPITLPP